MTYHLKTEQKSVKQQNKSTKKQITLKFRRFKHIKQGPILCVSKSKGKNIGLYKRSEATVGCCFMYNRGKGIQRTWATTENAWFFWGSPPYNLLQGPLLGVVFPPGDLSDVPGPHRGRWSLK